MVKGVEKGKEQEKSPEEESVEEKEGKSEHEDKNLAESDKEGEEKGMEGKTGEKPLGRPERTRESFRYFIADKLKLSEIGKAIPKEFHFTNAVLEIWAWVFIISIVLCIFQVPFGSIMAASPEPIGVGLPFPYLIFNIGGDPPLEFSWKGVILNVVIYLVIAYVLKVIYEIALKNIINMLKEKKGGAGLYSLFQKKDMGGDY